VKKTTRSLLVSLALVGMPVGGQLAEAQEGPAGAYPLGAERIHVGLASPTEAAAPRDTVEFAIRPEAGPPPEQPSEALPDSALSETESVPPGESVSLAGGTWGTPALGPCCAICGGGDSCPFNWYTRQEVRTLVRARARNNLTTSGLMVTNGVSTLQPLMTASSVPFNIAPGYAITLGRYLGRDTENCDRFLEFSYWGLNNWRESRQVNGTRFTDSSTFAQPVTFGSLFTPFARTTSIYDSPVGGFNRADQHLIRYQSDIDNFELNLRFSPRGRPDRLVLYPSGRWRRECQPGCFFSYLFGVRVMSVDETFDLHSLGDIIFGSVSSTVSGDYLSRTYNDLVGLQFGAELMHRNCKYSWGLRAKAGPYVNFSSYAMRAVNNAAGDPFATTPIDFERSATKSDAAFIGECSVVGIYRCRPNMALRASYDLMWVVALAMAPDQLTFQTNPPSHLNANATGYYQGLSLGFEWGW
jgi:hypothetical protein